MNPVGWFCDDWFFSYHDRFLTNMNFAYWVIYRGWVNLLLALNSHRLITGRHEYKWCHRHHVIATLCWVNVCHSWVTWWLLMDNSLGAFCRYREKVQLHMPLLQPVSNTHHVPFCHINVHLPFLSSPSVIPFQFPVPLLRCDHSRCLLVRDTLDFLQWGSKTRSNAC